MNPLMNIQHVVKSQLKKLIFIDCYQEHTIKFGPGKGIKMMLNRRHNIQIELGLYEAELHKVYRKFISHTAVVYDIGAANGDTATIFAKLADCGLVVAFEPGKAEIDRLRYNLILNPSLRERVKVVQAFVGEVGDVAQLESGPSVVSLDAMISEKTMPAPAFIKLDVDGAELAVLRGSEQCLRTYRPSLLVEVHSRELEDQCAAFLSEMGYTVEVVRNALWRKLYPEYRPIEHNRWILAFD